MVRSLRPRWPASPSWPAPSGWRRDGCASSTAWPATHPEGEIQQAAFQAGFVRNDGFMFLFFAIAQFHLGLKITPIADAEVGYLDVEKVMVALARGSACKVDLSDRWDFWPHMPRPLDEVRAGLGIPPMA